VSAEHSARDTSAMLMSYAQHSIDAVDVGD
jgi:hypothetical protein